VSSPRCKARLTMLCSFQPLLEYGRLLRGEAGWFQVSWGEMRWCFWEFVICLPRSSLGKLVSDHTACNEAQCPTCRKESGNEAQTSGEKPQVMNRRGPSGLFSPLIWIDLEMTGAHPAPHIYDANQICCLHCRSRTEVYLCKGI
jgi:hypothetical protein